MDSKSAPDELYQALHELVFTAELGIYPWWQGIDAQHTWEPGGKAPAHWSYRLTSGNPHGESGNVSKVIGFGEVANTVRMIASRTWSPKLNRRGTAPSKGAQRACNTYIRDPYTAEFTADQADEVLQMIMFGEILFGLATD